MRFRLPRLCSDCVSRGDEGWRGSSRKLLYNAGNPPQDFQAMSYPIGIWAVPALRQVRPSELSSRSTGCARTINVDLPGRLTEGR